MLKGLIDRKEELLLANDRRTAVLQKMFEEMEIVEQGADAQDGHPEASGSRPKKSAAKKH
jgi:hypothetical protein